MAGDRKPRIVRSGPVPEAEGSGPVAPEPAAPGTGAGSSKVTVMPIPSVEESAPPGATVLAFPVPVRRRRRRAIWIALIAIVAAVAAVVAIVMLTPVFALKTITVDGLTALKPAVIQSALTPLQDKPLTQIDRSQVWKLLEPIPQVQSVAIEARPPHTLLVHIVERVPVALLKSGSTYLLVDPNGVRLGTTADPAKVPLPLIDGGPASIGQANFKATTAVLAVLPPPVLAQLLKASASSPDAVELTLDNGKKVLWGNSSEQTLKAQVLQALLKATSADPSVSLYDISSPRHPVTR